MTTVLICDDHRIVREGLRQFVAAVPGVDKVETAASGEEVLARYPHEHPDLVLMDVRMPGLGGLEATRRLKADPATKDIPIIALTAHALASDQQKALEAGCDGYIAKPAEPRAVVAAVKKYLGEAGAAA